MTANTINITTRDLSEWFSRFFSSQARFTQRADLITAERALSVVPPEALDLVTTDVLEQVRRRLHDYSREDASRALNDIADLMHAGSQAREPHSIVFCVSNLIEDSRRLHEACKLFGDSVPARDLVKHIQAVKSLSGQGAMTEAHDKLENAARAIVSGYGEPWKSEPCNEGPGVDVGTQNEEGEFNEFIHVEISNYSGEESDDHELADYLAYSRPANIVAMFDLIRAQKAQIEALQMENHRLERDAMPALEFWLAASDSLNELMPLEMLAARSFFPADQGQKNMLARQPAKRLEMVMALVRQHNAERLEQKEAVSA